MSERKWTIRTLSILTALVIGLIVTVNFIIDPYGEFRLIEGDYNKLKLKAEKTTALQVSSKLYDGKYALVFGSSRTMLLSSEIMGEPVLNFSTSLYNNPGDILALLEMLNKKQLANITHIYFLVDINGFHYTSAAPEMLNKGTLLLETLKNLGPKKIEEAWNCLTANNQKLSESNYPNYIDSYGTLHKQETPYKTRQPHFSSHVVTPYFLNSLKKINSFSANHAIETTFFTTPWQQPFISSLQTKVTSILNNAAIACGGLLNFQLHPEFIGKTSLFYDPSHLNTSGLKLFVKLLRSSQTEKVSIENSNKINPANYKTITSADLLDIINNWNKDLDTDSFIQAICETHRNDLIILLYENIEKLGQTKLLFTGKSILYAKPERIKPILEKNGMIHHQYFKEISLQDAIMSGNINMIKSAILLGADVNSINTYGASPLFVAAVFSPNSEIIKILLKTGADPFFIPKTASSGYYLNQSVFTLALKQKNQILLNFLTSQFPNHPLSRHAILLAELNKHPDNALAFKEAAALNRKYYNSSNPLMQRLHLNRTDIEKVSTSNNVTTLKFGTTELVLTPREAYLYEHINVLNNVYELIEETTKFQANKLSFQGTREQHFQAIFQDIGRLVGNLNQHNAIWILD
ncbi:hypothetical protein [Maridesulfovibrio ferrireducens]|uniref:hypothetical protein n=1 Tax=Maridesulfovibrio ferrireducens TaxID=246191 RepID=UPI001A2C19A3|nr:hypothetical protein [Maridesulfovibrio ferrireducens]MBI9112679.1 hypothetical protein [Maridesulfovibrio ferrireducens]